MWQGGGVAGRESLGKSFSLADYRTSSSKPHLSFPTVSLYLTRAENHLKINEFVFTTHPGEAVGLAQGAGLRKRVQKSHFCGPLRMD